MSQVNVGADGVELDEGRARVVIANVFAANNQDEGIKLSATGLGSVLVS